VSFGAFITGAKMAKIKPLPKYPNLHTIIQADHTCIMHYYTNAWSYEYVADNYCYS